jgi:predicted nucleic acid-binding protein
MIVVDTNVLAHLFLNGEHRDAARRLIRHDPDWVAPLLWRSEFRSVLTQRMRVSGLGVALAGHLMDLAEGWLHGQEYSVRSRDVLSLAERSTCSAYDCEFVALAVELAVPLVTIDREILEAFDDVATDLRSL